MANLHRYKNANRANLFRVLCFSLLAAAGAPGLAAQGTWIPVGPDGGDARAISFVPGHPAHLFVGTTHSLIYESRDAGASWRQLAKLDSADDLVIDHIVVDPVDVSLMYAAAWKFDHPDGGLWTSHDSGKTWQELAGLHGQSVMAFVAAPSDRRILFAGTLEGVFRSMDAGASWTEISPAGSQEIHEIESLAVDPRDPQIVYAGTWHLPWKTSDGGEHWENIKEGVIDDSDVFSILIDPGEPDVVYMSACSGIYKSETAGAEFRKIEGIPATARRTRVLRQDPARPATVYAGTTQGLYQTEDGGSTFRRLTGPDVIVNDVFVDPGNTDHVMITTDRGGVLASADAGASFTAANHGFFARKVQALMVDAHDPSRLYAGVVNDKKYGGAFVSGDGGLEWNQVATGLDGRDVFVLAESGDGDVVAGTNNGIFKLEEGAWVSHNTIANSVAKRFTAVKRGRRVTVEKKVKQPVLQFSGRVRAMDLQGDAWLAATSSGLFTSRDKGATWQGGPGQGVDFVSVTARGSTMVAASPGELLLSEDAGATWSPMSFPTAVTRIHCVELATDGTLWLGSREGVYFTSDKGKTWMWVHRLPLVDVSDIYYDPRQSTVLVSSRSSDVLYAIDAKTLDWKWRQTGYRLLMVRTAGDRLLAASLDNGVLLEPRGQGSMISDP
jgi:photosystem II stability/assembly factor-like uncharacterized protein